jgi:hypothetical protein
MARIIWKVINDVKNPRILGYFFSFSRSRVGMHICHTSSLLSVGKYSLSFFYTGLITQEMHFPHGNENADSESVFIQIDVSDVND